MLATPAHALMQSVESIDGVSGEPEGPPLVIAQGGCTSLSQAVEQVRRRGDVERVISAETQVQRP